MLKFPLATPGGESVAIEPAAIAYAEETHAAEGPTVHIQTFDGGYFVVRDAGRVVLNSIIEAKVSIKSA